MQKNPVIFWFRRDLRFQDNVGFYRALKSGHPVIPLFIFDSNILEKLEDKDDRRVNFIHQTITALNDCLISMGSSIQVKHGKPEAVWPELLKQHNPAAVYTNHDYEPYAKDRDQAVKAILSEHKIPFYTYKDQVIFEKDEVLTRSDTPYTVYTPYRNAWMERFSSEGIQSSPSQDYLDNCIKCEPQELPAISDLGFSAAHYRFPSTEVPEDIIHDYQEKRDYPAIAGTSRLSVHLRFGTVSVRELVQRAADLNETWLSELIWREFFMAILWHFPHVVNSPFRKKYKLIPWRDDADDFQRWCEGQTGYPIVDAGMRELNETGFMHNRVRMITAGFLTKHLLIDWRRGEAYFARKLLDYELASNNGNWQWAAGCGCDAAPYFRIFNPYTQAKKFDPDRKYIRQWVPEVDGEDYPKAMVDHKWARERTLTVFKSALEKYQE